MKKLILIVVAVLVVIVAFYCVNKYNEMVTAGQKTESSWAGVQTQYQRRSDLIPNLVSTVKGYADHESETLENVTKARAEATAVNVDASQLSEEELERFVEAQSKVTSSLGKLIAVAESYPELKANENFKELQAQLEGTENRIAVARNEFNGAVREYNLLVMRFPANIVASMFGFDKKAYFEAQGGASEAPKVEF